MSFVKIDYRDVDMHDAPDDFVDYEDYEETPDETNYLFLKDGEYCL